MVFKVVGTGRHLIIAEVPYLVRFAAVGVSGIAVNTATLFGLTEFMQIDYRISALFALLVSFVSNFALNEKWTFQDRASVLTLNQKFRRFLPIAVGGYAISYIVLVALTDSFGVYYLLSNLAGIFVAFVWNYSLNRRYTWK